jgi:serine/threonine protein phosphatase 1
MKLIRASAQRRLAPEVAPGKRVYAVGDIHGRSDLLEVLIRRIDQDDFARPATETWIIILGNFIDRGPETAASITLLRSWQASRRNVVVLLGNREAALIESLQGDEIAQDLWVGSGGAPSLTSFGLDPRREGEPGLAFSDRLLDGVSKDTVGWLQSLPLRWSSGDYFFCHAGVRPGIPIESQRDVDLLWPGKEFKTSRRYHGAVVVHGHSGCCSRVHVATNRICVDTLAFRSGVLSAIGLEGRSRWIINTAL